MAEGSYEYECMRAELLGIEKPDYDEFMKTIKKQEKKEVEEEEVDVENAKVVDFEEEGMTKISGRLDELNNILKKTQSKINRMKVSCGSVAGLLKNRLGSFSQQSSFDSEQAENAEASEKNSRKLQEVTTDNPEEEEEEEEEEETMINPQSSDTDIPVRKSDLQKALDKDLSALDAMIEKAEHAQYSMSHQTKQMKKFIK